MQPRADAGNLRNGGRNREAAGDPLPDDGDSLGDLLSKRNEQEARWNEYADDDEQHHQKRGHRRGAARRGSCARKEPLLYLSRLLIYLLPMIDMSQ